MLIKPGKISLKAKYSKGNVIKILWNWIKRSYGLAKAVWIRVQGKSILDFSFQCPLPFCIKQELLPKIISWMQMTCYSTYYLGCNVRSRSDPYISWRTHMKLATSNNSEASLPYVVINFSPRWLTWLTGYSCKMIEEIFLLHLLRGLVFQIISKQASSKWEMVLIFLSP